MRKLTIILALMMFFSLSTAIAQQIRCEDYDGESDAVFFQNMDIMGKQVSIYKTDSTKALCRYYYFCERMGMNWYAPDSGAEADAALTQIRAIDNYHTWIINKATTVLGASGVATWNGQILTTADSPDCLQSSSSGFSAIRDWGCSMCDPEQYGVSKCWDYDHVYDWIVCQGEYVPPIQDNEVPEFTAIGASIVLIGAVIVISSRRNN